MIENNAGSHTWNEITQQPQAWQDALRTFDAHKEETSHFLRQYAGGKILVVGCGSTYYLARSAATLLRRRAGREAIALPGSEAWLYPSALPQEQALLLAISRSGTTTETLRALEHFRSQNGGKTLTITCYPETPLAQQADLALVAAGAQEQSIAQTRSFTSMFVLAQALTALLVDDEAMLERLHHLPDVLADLMERTADLTYHLGSDLSISHLFILGGGALYGLACETMLKLKEMSLTHAEAYHPLEIRHGPMSMVNDEAMVVGFLSDTGLNEEVKVLQEMQELGGKVLAIAEDATALNGWHPDYLIELRSGLNEWERAPLYVPILQRIAYHRAIVKELNPDQPTHLKAVIEL